MERATKSLPPKYNLPSSPQYEHPGLNNNPRFQPVVTMPLATFIFNVLYSAISALGHLPDKAVWANVTVGIAAAVKQTYDSWKTLHGERRPVTKAYASPDKKWYLQL